MKIRTLRFILAASILSIAWMLAPSTASADDPNVTVHATDGKGGDLAGVVVHFYEGNVGKCSCPNNVCGIAPDKTENKKTDTTDKKGIAKTKGLKPGKMYVACVNDSCGGACPGNCNITGSCSQGFTTNKAGGVKDTITIP